MRIPWLFHAAAWSQAAPPLAALLRRRAPPPRGWIVLWALMASGADALGLWLARRGVNNHFLDYLWSPLATSVLIYGLSAWLPGAFLRNAYRSAIPVFLLTSGALVFLLEDTARFSLVTGPLNALLLLAASCGVLLGRLQGPHASLLHADWFWVSLGVAIRYGTDTAVQPFALLYVGTEPALVTSVLSVRAVLDVIAALLIAGGMLCPSAPTPSGGSSWPGSSPPASWSARSASPR